VNFCMIIHDNLFVKMSKYCLLGCIKRICYEKLRMGESKRASERARELNESPFSILLTPATSGLLCVLLHYQETDFHYCVCGGDEKSKIGNLISSEKAYDDDS
jgi:hypothetical protein